MFNKINIPLMILFLALLSPVISLADSAAEQPEYESVPTGEERRSDSDFMSFPGWQDIAIVQDGHVNETYAAQLDASQWDADIPMDSFKWLVLRDFDIKTAGIASTTTSALIPFAVGLRYQAGGYFWSEMISQGTINAMGTIELVIKDDKIVDVKVLKYYDSQDVEQYERKLGLINKYDSDFVVGIIRPLLKNYLTAKQNLQILIDLVETHQEKNEGPIKL